MAPSSRTLLLALALSCYFVTAAAWGRDGHTATAKIGQALMTPEAVSNAAKYFPTGDLGDIANWADTVREEFPWSERLHFVNLPDGTCNYTPKACPDSNCVVGAIHNYTSILSRGPAASDLTAPFLRSSRSAGASELLEDAFKWTVHYIGDCHQPLHVGWTTDRGGNTIHVTFNDKEMPLHGLWDYGMIERWLDDQFSGSADKWYADLITRAKSGDFSAKAPKWLECASGAPICPEDWAQESAQDACADAYKGVKDGQHISDSYYQANIQLVELRIAQAGVRMAAVLNKLFA